ncbi:MAG: hypothetical protein GY809_16760, partial [Planctomycetes bacterium]|nr:hypothetical protein [Planctomycetota bacterium]
MNGRNQQLHIPLFFLLLLLTFALWGCASPPTAAAPCATSNGFILLPTLIPRDDPNSEEPRDELIYTFNDEDCGFDLSTTPKIITGDGWLPGKLQNITLDPQDAVLHSVATGQNNMAVAWTSGGDVYVGISRGGASLQIEQVDRGANPDLIFSSRARLHLVYEQDGQIIYRYADGDAHPAQSVAEVIDAGSRPRVAVDPRNWGHVLYFQENQVMHAIQFGSGYWWDYPLRRIAEEINLAHSSDHMILILQNDNQIDLFQYWFSENPYLNWWPLGNWSTEAEIQGVPQVGFKSPDLNNEFFEYDPSEPYWIVASWVEREPTTITTTLPAYLQPLWEAVDAPIASGVGATLWHGNNAAYDAGLYQTTTVTITNAITVTAQVGSFPYEGASVSMRLGLDLNGGTDPESGDIIWSATAVNPLSYTQLQATAVATGTLDVTVFLHAVTTGPDVDALWDDVQLLAVGDLLNSDFEEGVYTYSTLPNIPNSWTPFFTDDYAAGTLPSFPADRYTVQTVWSSDRGETWQGPEVVTENSELAVGSTGAFAP